MTRTLVWWTKLSPTLLRTLGIIFLAGYAWPIINPNLSDALRHYCNWSLVIIWIFFAIDYIARLLMSTNKRVFVRSNLLDLAAVLLPFLPLLRAIRALVAVTVLSRRNRGSRSRQVTTSVVTFAFATWFVAGLAVTEAERHVDGANINDVGDGWWWAISTMATVGYGDTYPVSPQGRVVGTALMVMGIALLGTITAAIASNFNSANVRDSVDGVDSSEPSLVSMNQVQTELDVLQKRVAELEQQLKK